MHGVDCGELTTGPRAAGGGCDDTGSLFSGVSHLYSVTYRNTRTHEQALVVLDVCHLFPIRFKLLQHVRRARSVICHLGKASPSGREANDNACHPITMPVWTTTRKAWSTSHSWTSLPPRATVATHKLFVRLQDAISCTCWGVTKDRCCRSRKHIPLLTLLIASGAEIACTGCFGSNYACALGLITISPRPPPVL